MDGDRPGAIVVFGQNRPRLQGAGDKVLVPEPLPDDNVGALVRRCVVARIDRDPEHDVAILRSARQSRVHQRSTGLCRLPRVRHRGQRLVPDVNGVRSVRSGVRVDGNDGGDALALEPDHLVGEQPMNRNLHARQDPVRRQRRHRVQQIHAGHDGHDIRHLEGAFNGNRLDPGVSVRTAQQCDMQGASRIGRPHVVGKTSPAPEMMVVFTPR